MRLLDNIFKRFKKKDQEENSVEEENIDLKESDLPSSDSIEKMEEEEAEETFYEAGINEEDEDLEGEDVFSSEESCEADLEEGESKGDLIDRDSRESVEEDTDSEEAPEEEKDDGVFSKFLRGLKKTRQNFQGSVEKILTGHVKIDEELFEELEDLMVSSDIGVESTMELMDNLRESVDSGLIKEPNEVKSELNRIMKEKLSENQDGSGFTLDKDRPTVLLVIGVNGVGKTTSIGKLAYRYKSQGYDVMLAAADTFRAAAIDQLDVWSKRADVDMIAHQEGADPGAVIYDAIQSAKSKKTDLLICDTAGRLHNKKNLMNELEKINRIINRDYPEANKEVLIVLDATTGQNAINQTREFKEVTDVTGIILTKMDGTAKGGVVFPLQMELNIPVKFIGIGEGIEDLQAFDVEAFVDAIIS